MTRQALTAAIEAAAHSPLEMTPERICALDGAIALLDAFDGDPDMEDDEREADPDFEPTAEVLLEPAYAYYFEPIPVIAFCPCCGHGEVES